MKITYLLGAGASINSVPAVSGMNVHLKHFLNLIEKENEEDYENKHSFNEFKDQLKLIVDNLKDFSTVDKYAKKVSSQNGERGINKLKITFAIYLILIQFLNKKLIGLTRKNGNTEIPYDTIDKRYNDFLTDILINKNGVHTVHENIKILTWNYDIQFECAYDKFVGNNNLDRTFGDISVYPNTNNIRSNFYNGNTESPSLVHLNGLAGLSHEFRNVRDKDAPVKVYTFYDRIKDSKSISQSLDSLLYLYNSNNSRTSGILETMTFAFEQEYGTFKNSKTFATDIAKETDVLVVIGYSVPLYNYESDRDFFLSLKAGCKIIIQNPNDIRNNLKDYYSLEEKNIIWRGAKHELTNFYIPKEFYEFK